MVGTRKHPEDFPPPAMSTSTSTSTTSKALKPQSQPAARKQATQWSHYPSRLVLIWLLVSVPAVIWDTGYVLLRPHSMPGGAYHYFWTPYALYATIDYIYGWPAFNSRNGFTAAQSIVNIVETALYCYYLYIVWSQAKPLDARKTSKTSKGTSGWPFMQEMSVGGSSGARALLAIYSASLMTLSKTMLYGLNEVCSGYDNVGHNDIFTLVFLYILPNGLWILFPSIATCYHGKEIYQSLGGPK